MKSCLSCNTKEICTIYERIADIITQPFFCSRWEFTPRQAILSQPGMRLGTYADDDPVATLPFKHLKFLDMCISSDLTDTEVTVVAEINKHVSLIYLPTYDSHCYINNKGLLVKSC